MRSLFSLLNVKYEPPTSGSPSRPTSISTVSVTGPSGPSIVVTAVGSEPEQLVEPAQLGRVVPVHPHAQADRLLRLAGREREHPLLAQGHEPVDAVRLDVALGREAEVALDVDLHPQALAVEPVLVALVLALHRVEALVEVLVRATPRVVDAHRVVRGDRPVEEAPARPALVLRAEARERPSLGPLAEQLVLLGDEVGLGGDGTEHRASVGRRAGVRRCGAAASKDTERGRRAPQGSPVTAPTTASSLESE